MSLSMIACLAASVFVSIIVIFMAVGALNLALPFGQAIPAAVAALIGIIAGRAIHARFFAGR